MVPESRLEPTEHGLVPKGEGWFVLNAREARWRPAQGRGAFCVFEGEPEFSQLGIHLVSLAPGEPMAMYHWEADQEDFLVLAGEALLIVEGEERPLRSWDLVHCPAGTKHVVVGAGAAPCLVVAVGARDRSTGPGWGGYSVDEAALRHGAGVEQETTDAEQAYARFPRREPSASQAHTATAGCPSRGPVMEAQPTVSPELSVRRGREALEFYKAAFGAVEIYRVGGTERHEEVVAQLAVGNASFWVSDESPPNGHFSPESLGGSTVRVLLIVQDPHAVVARALAMGATDVAPVEEGHGWLLGRIADPFGHQWEIGKPLIEWPPAHACPAERSDAEDYETALRALYERILDGWNRRSGEDFAAVFAEDGEAIGFDGSRSDGRAAIAAELERIFADHDTGTYVGKVTSLRPLGSEAAVLRAAAGIVPAGRSDLEPKLNAVQSLVAERRGGEWRVVVYQNTPAQFHGRPELVESLTHELRQELRSREPR